LLFSLFCDGIGGLNDFAHDPFFGFAYRSAFFDANQIANLALFFGVMHQEPGVTLDVLFVAGVLNDAFDFDLDGLFGAVSNYLGNAAASDNFSVFHCSLLLKKEADRRSVPAAEL